MRKARDFEDFLTWFPAVQAELLSHIRAFLQERYPSLTESIKYGVPFWSGYKNILYVNGGKEGIYIGFLEGWQLNDPQMLLRGEGKVVRKYFVRTLQDLHPHRIGSLVEEAIALDEERRLIGKKKKLPSRHFT